MLNTKFYIHIKSKNLQDIFRDYQSLAANDKKGDEYITLLLVRWKNKEIYNDKFELRYCSLPLLKILHK